jgi:mono/diheme cytochrome c family protein
VRTIIRAAGLCLAIVAAIANVSAAAGEKASKEKVERGRYLVNLGGCHDCHSPKIFTEKGPEPDPALELSGHPAGSTLPAADSKVYTPGYGYFMAADLTAFVGPWGTSYAMNLTPDEQTGIGLWTEEIFVKALRTGLHMGAGRPILPPMPWAALAQATDEDLSAIYAYLRSLPAIKNPVPAPVPPPGAPAGQ